MSNEIENYPVADVVVDNIQPINTIIDARVKLEKELIDIEEKNELSHERMKEIQEVFTQLKALVNAGELSVDELKSYADAFRSEKDVIIKRKARAKEIKVALKILKDTKLI